MSYQFYNYLSNCTVVTLKFMTIAAKMTMNDSNMPSSTNVVVVVLVLILTIIIPTKSVKTFILTIFEPNTCIQLILLSKTAGEIEGKRVVAT